MEITAAGKATGAATRAPPTADKIRPTFRTMRNHFGVGADILLTKFRFLFFMIVAYFIKQLHTDFKSMERDMSEVKTMALIIKTEFRTSYDIMTKKLEYLEQRISKLEINESKKQDHEK